MATAWARISPIIGVLTLIVAAPVAHASTPLSSGVTLVNCVGTVDNQYDPGVTLERREVLVTAEETLAVCMTSDLAVFSGGLSLTRHVTLSCLELLDPGPGTNERTYTWNTGQTSTFRYSLTQTTLAGERIITRTGTIIDGLFAGSTAVSVITIATVNVLDCLGHGITSRHGTLTLIIAL